jgi:molybdopterin-guanine dinucleotide biosynthesis protein A
MKSPRLLGVVLCGGRSKRMGSDKARLVHATGISFLEHAAARVADVCDDVRLCGHPRAECQYPRLEDTVAFQGPLTGIINALTFADHHALDGCLVTPLDMPHLTADDLRKLRTIWQQSPDQLVCAVSEDEIRIQPLVAIYPTRLKEAISQLARSEHRSLRRWIAQQDHLEVTLEPSACHNVNNPEDLHA